jgi:hypothetical protein
LPPRGWELLVGVLAAFYMFDRERRLGPSADAAVLGTTARQVLGAVGLGLIAYAIFTFDSSTPTPGVYTLIPATGALLIILFADSGSLAGKLLGYRPIVGIGLISYSAYLWHQPLFAFARIFSLKWPSTALLAFLSLASLALAYLSWRFVERPFRDRKRVSSKAIFLSASAATAIFICIGYVGYGTSALNNLYLARLSEVEKSHFLAALETFNLEPREHGDCHFYAPKPDEQIGRHFDHCFEKYGKAIVVIGDSHAIDLYEGLALTAEAPFVFGLAELGCWPHTPDTGCQLDKIASFLRDKHEKIRRVIYEQAGHRLVHNNRGEAGRRSFFNGTDVPIYDISTSFVDSVRDYLAQIAKDDLKVVWLGPRIEPNVSANWLLRMATECTPEQLSINSNVIANFVKVDHYLQDYFAKSENAARITYLSQIEASPLDVKNDLYRCGVTYWRDVDHWSEAGARRFGARLLPILMPQQAVGKS